MESLTYFALPQKVNIFFVDLFCVVSSYSFGAFSNRFHFYIFDPFQNTRYEKPKLWIIHKLKHFVTTTSTSRTVQVFFLHNYLVMPIIFYFLCHIFYKTWVFFYYSKFDYLWRSLHCFLRGWQLFLCNNWLPDWLVWNTFLRFAEIANILALCIARFCCVLCCNKQWSYWHVLPLPQKVNIFLVDFFSSVLCPLTVLEETKMLFYIILSCLSYFIFLVKDFGKCEYFLSM